jgi:hypothetical protein
MQVMRICLILSNKTRPHAGLGSFCLRYLAMDLDVKRATTKPLFHLSYEELCEMWNGDDSLNNMMVGSISYGWSTHAVRILRAGSITGTKPKISLDDG